MSEPFPQQDMAPRLSPRRQALQTRVSAAIIEAAAGVFAHSPEPASMGDVAAAAGVARATLYRYFPSRHALLDALGHAAVVDASARLESARVDEVGLEEGVARAVRALLEVGDAFIVLLRGGLHSSEFERGVVRPLRRLFDRALARGELRADVPQSWLTEALVALVVAIASATPALGKEDTVAAISGIFLQGAHARPHAVS